jgi:hypothetical protein
LLDFVSRFRYIKSGSIGTLFKIVGVRVILNFKFPQIK